LFKLLKPQDEEDENEKAPETIRQRLITDHLIEELESVYDVANREHQSTIINFLDKGGDAELNEEEKKEDYGKVSVQLIQPALSEQEMDPPERDVLPYFKDPKIKISIWTIIKDSIGKDISKLSVPVYFNDTTNILQKCAVSMEYNEILDLAM
jgi:hypothetical protein